MTRLSEAMVCPTKELAKARSRLNPFRRREKAEFSKATRRPRHKLLRSSALVPKPSLRCSTTTQSQKSHYSPTKSLRSGAKVWAELNSLIEAACTTTSTRFTRCLSSTKASFSSRRRTSGQLSSFGISLGTRDQGTRVSSLPNQGRSCTSLTRP